MQFLCNLEAGSRDEKANAIITVMGTSVSVTYATIVMIGLETPITEENHVHNFCIRGVYMTFS